jgi:hypothetical protein
MPMVAAAFPILPGKTGEWRAWMAEANGARRAEFEASRAEYGIHERAYLQQTPMGDLVIVTMEGADPAGAFSKMMGADTDFARWFAGKAKEVHGFDVTELPPGDPSELILDTERSTVPA